MQSANDLLRRRLDLNVRAWPVQWHGRANTVIAQAPPKGTHVAAGDTVIFCFVQRTIPNVWGRTPDGAAQMLARAGYSSVRRDSVATSATRIGRVFLQRPAAGAAADSGMADTIFVRIAASVPPAQGAIIPNLSAGSSPTVRMPHVIGLTYTEAADTMTQLSRLMNPPPMVVVRGANNARFVRGRSVVDSQSPRRGTLLTVRSKVQLIMREITRAAPMPDTLPPTGSERMPPLIGSSRNAAIDSVTAINKRAALNLRFSERGVNGTAASAGASARVDSQWPQPGALLSLQDNVLIILRDTAPLPARMPELMRAPSTEAMENHGARDARTSTQKRTIAPAPPPHRGERALAMSAAPKVTVCVSHTYSASREHVFDAWLDPDQAATFLFATVAGQIVRCDIDARMGGTFAIVDRRDGEDIEHVDTYIEIDAHAAWPLTSRSRSSRTNPRE